MSKISFAFETDPGDAEGLVVLQNLVSALASFTKGISKTTEPIKVPENLEETKIEAAAKIYPDRTDKGKFPEPLLKETDEEREARITENKAAIIKQKTAVKTPVEATATNTSAPKEGKIKVEDLRALLSRKVGNNRAACKAKLTEMGTTSMTLLDPSRYEEMFNFLTALE